MNFESCCALDNQIEVAKRLQQIRADSSEIKRRINCFVNRKRDEINNYNVQDFISNQTSKDMSAIENDMTCARVNSTLYRAKGSKSHLKVHRVKNEYGPQTTNYKGALDKLMENVSPVKIKPDPDGPSVLPLSIQERIINAEAHLNLPVERLKTKSIVDRIKAIEDKILYLETLSPEYSHFLVTSKRYLHVSYSKLHFLFFFSGQIIGEGQQIRFKCQSQGRKENIYSS